MRLRTVRYFFLVLAAAGLALAAAGTAVPPQAVLSPLNPDYVRYLADLRTGVIPAYAPGRLTPSPQDISHLASLPPAQYSALPAVYDLRVLNKMTPVRDEGASGGSLAFAALASLESWLKPLETWDFSEKHLLASLQGAGYLEAVVGALARWDDPVRESDDPWPTGEAAASLTVKHVQNVAFIPPRTGPLDNDGLKQAVMQGGAVYAEMTYLGTLINPATAAYYNAATDGEKRAVALAGWDDAFDRNKFTPPAPGNGAFICKNSFGPTYANAGYFYVSYYDGFFGRRSLSAAFKAEPLSAYTVNYQYDVNGCTGRLGLGVETGWFANVFTATSADPLAAVSLYTYSPNAAYDITIYKNPAPGQPASGTALARVTGTLVDPGYATIPLKASVPLLPNDRFSVVAGLTMAGDPTPIPVEFPVTGTTAVYAANPGEGYVSRDGAEWMDLTTLLNDTFSRSSLCLKAFAGGGAALYPPAELKLERLTNNFFFFKEYVDRLSWSANPNNAAAPVKYRIYRRSTETAGTEFQFLGETTPDFLYYFVRGVKKTDAFVYRVTAVMADGRESDPAEIAI